MPHPDDLPAALAQLGALGNNPGIDIRPVVLRVVVDLFLQKQHHAPDELRTFEAIVGPLLDNSDPDTRRIVAGKLAGHSATPVALLDRLLDEQSQSGGGARSAPLAPEDLLVLAEHGTVEEAATVAHREDLPLTVILALAARPELRVAMALAGNGGVVLDDTVLPVLIGHARNDSALAGRLADRVAAPLTLAPLFPLLAASHRQRILDAVRRLHLGRRQWGRPDRDVADVLARLDRLARSDEWDGFDQVLCTALGYDERLLRPLLHDGSGDVLALALAALGAPADLAARIFILGDPGIGRSVNAVRRLFNLVDTMAPAGARGLLDAMLVGEPAVDVLRRTPQQTRPVPGQRRLGEAFGMPEQAPVRRETSPASPLRRRSS